MESIDVTGELDPERAEALLDVIRTRRSVRSFEPGRRVSRDVLAQIADAGRWAPSGANSQPWDICIVEDPAAIASTAQVLSAQADRLNEHCRGFPHVHKKHWVHDAVAIVVLFVDVRWSAAYPLAPDAVIDQEEYAANRDQILLVSAGAATQNIQLAATAVGLTSAWLSGGGEPQTAREMQDLLGFPETHVPYAIVPIGWPVARARSITTSTRNGATRSIATLSSGSSCSLAARTTHPTRRSRPKSTPSTRVTSRSPSHTLG